MADATLPGAAPRRRPGRRKDVETGRLRVHDPFELIRWLALSQPDPRKALAELVQNSLDAGARTIRVVRRREKGRACLVIWDDGEGVIPELDRPEALRFIATHVGHRRKRSLTPQQRLELLTQGQYGIGLLGFWSLGEVLEMRTSVPGQRPHRLVLFRDRAALPVEERDEGEAAGREANQGMGAPAPEPLPEVPLPEPEVVPPEPFLFPPGPLVEVRILPSLLRLECGGERRARALAVDAAGRPVEAVLAYAWRLTGGAGELVSEDDASPAVTVRAGDRPGKGSLAVVCRSGSVEARDEARVEVVEQLGAGRDEGIPEPELLDLPGAPWRSRVSDGRWQVNSGHSEYRAIADRPQLKLRYLALLFAKEVVLRSGGDPRFEAPLEQLVEVAAYADRRLAASRGRRRKGEARPRSEVTPAPDPKE
jgi:hypothetical protein